MTAAAANALTTQGSAQRGTVAAALDFLASRQHEDGTFSPDWSSSRHHTVFRAALAAAEDADAPESSAQRITARCRRLVLSSQNDDGGWGQQDGSSSDTSSTAYALITLTAVGGHQAHEAACGGAAYLLGRQHPNGSINDGISDSIGPRPFGFTVPLLADAFALLALGHLTHRPTSRELAADNRTGRPTPPGPPAHLARTHA
ncbi:prenyltransferase/squalene oxidase repeat-containing protein [Embleya sp. NPDC127516]|uniref:prenyltransferase/squalene oxidase repeat-containing protein n=1 Tax=Embleya sp. NPDC127516 TaxID=3363990 RepID=UPI00380B61DD